MDFVALDHVQLALPPGGEDAARRFYGQGLGMTEVPKPEDLARRGGCWFEAGSIRLHLGVEEGFRPARKAHPAFEVSDLESLSERLTKMGHPPRADEPLAGWSRAYFEDPFGNRIELMQKI